MDELKREQIALFVAKFRDSAYTQEALDEFAKMNGMDTIAMSELSDYVYQVKNDEIMSVLYPRVLEMLQKTRYVYEFASKKDRTEAIQANKDVEKEIAKIIEDTAVDYKMVEVVCRDFGAGVAQMLNRIGNTLSNRAVIVLMDLARKQFGNEFNMKHVKAYLDENGKAE